MTHFTLEKIMFIAFLGAFALSGIYSRNAQAQAAALDVHAQVAQTTAALAEGEPLFSLDRCIEIALAKNPEIAAAQWDISAADSRLDVARAALWPQVSVEGGYLRYLDDQRLMPTRYNGEPGVFDRNILRGDLVAKMALYTGGRIAGEAETAGKLSEAEKEKFVRTRDELIYGVTGIYFSILGQQKILTSLGFSQKALEENKKRVAQLYEVQKAAKVDLLRTEVRLSDLNQAILKEENTLAVQKRILFNLMGYETVPEGVRFDDVAGFPSEILFDVRQLTESALKNRPDYQAAKTRLEAQALRVATAKSGSLPSVSLVGSYGLRDAPTPADKGKNTRALEDAGSVGIVFSVPLFEGGRVAAKVAEESAILAAARDRLKKLELQIRQETETATLDVLSSSARFRATEKSIEQAKESLRIESLKYELGRGSIMDVLDSQAALLQAETSNCRSCIDYHISMARLKLAVGGTL